MIVLTASKGRWPREQSVKRRRDVMSPYSALKLLISTRRCWRRWRLPWCHLDTCTSELAAAAERGRIICSYFVTIIVPSNAILLNNHVIASIAETVRDVSNYLLGTESYARTKTKSQKLWGRHSSSLVHVWHLPSLLQSQHFNLFIKQKDRSATYIDMHEIHVGKL